MSTVCSVYTHFLWKLEHSVVCYNMSGLFIPIVWVIGLLPHTFSVLLIAFYGAPFSNVIPRSNFNGLTTKKVPIHIQQMAMKAQGAHRNGHECFPLFVAAVLIMNGSPVPFHKQNVYAISYAVLRILFNTLYIFVSSEGVSLVRSLVWNMCNILTFSMIIEGVVAQMRF
ncbi:uncharacterized protein V1518DRAFT_413630 [Limtongia smithiae]|uniref:uncharacterized protein n=1 Tax=Limtongia smithiae TaxID=1125753 RepID=UPI0034CF7BD8